MLLRNLLFVGELFEDFVKRYDFLGKISQSKKRYMSDTPDGDKFRNYTQSIIVIMAAICITQMYWNCQTRR